MFGGAGSTLGHNFYTGTQNGSKLDIWRRQILIHTLELKLKHFKVLSYVCIGNHVFAMFAHEKNYRRVGYVDDFLLNIVYIALRMPACIVWLYYASSLIMWRILDNPFFCLVCGSLEKHVKAWSNLLHPNL